MNIQNKYENMLILLMMELEYKARIGCFKVNFSVIPTVPQFIPIHPKLHFWDELGQSWSRVGAL
jgi:hypothetical protein